MKCQIARALWRLNEMSDRLLIVGLALIALAAWWSWLVRVTGLNRATEAAVELTADRIMAVNSAVWNETVRVTR
jgi:hypothetical protein